MNYEMFAKLMRAIVLAPVTLIFKAVILLQNELTSYRNIND